MAHIKEYFEKLVGGTYPDVDLDIRDRNGGELNIEGFNFTYSEMPDSCGVCVVHEFSGELSKKVLFPLLRIFFLMHPESDFEDGEYEDELFECGFSHMIFYDQTTTDDFKCMKRLFDKTTVETNPNTGNKVILYTLTRSSFNKLYNEYTTELAAKAAKPKAKTLPAAAKRYSPVAAARRKYGFQPMANNHVLLE